MIAAHFLKWRKQFSLYRNYLGFFDNSISVANPDAQAVLGQIVKVLENPEDVREIVILPIVHEPPDLTKVLSALSELRQALFLHISGEGIQNFFVYPVIKTATTNLKAEEIISPLFNPSAPSTADHSMGAIPPFFLFQGSRLTLEPYRDAEWLCDMENFLSLTIEIERQGLDFFTYFPRPRENELEIATFATQTVHSDKYMEIHNYVSLALKEWIDSQLTEADDCRPSLPPISAETEKISGIGKNVTDDDLKDESTIIEEGNFRYFSNLRFDLIKNHLDEFERTDLLGKLQETAAEQAEFLEKIMIKEFGEKTSDLKKMVPKGPIDYLSLGEENLVRNNSTINCLLKEIEDNMSSKIPELDSVNRRFADWVFEKATEAGTAESLRAIAEKMKAYIKGIPFKRLAVIYVLGFIVIFYLVLKVSGILPFMTSLKWEIAASMLLSLSFPWLYHRYWHAKRRKDLERMIGIFCQRIRVSVSSATRAFIQNSLNFYFNRYAKRMDISLKREMLRLKRFLENAKKSLADLRATSLTMSPTRPPSELESILNQVRWEHIFTALESWDSQSVRFYLDTKLNEVVNQFIKEFSPDYRFTIDKDFQKSLLKRFTFQIPESCMKARILFPAIGTRSALQEIDQDLIIEYDKENTAIIIGIGKRSFSQGPER